VGIDDRAFVPVIKPLAEAWLIMALLLVAAWQLDATRARGQDVSETRLSISGPDHAVLGTDKSLQLRITDAPSAPALFANIGSVSEPVADGKDAWIVSFTLPTSRFPQVAIIAAAHADRSQVAWLRIPLWGHPTLHIESEPLAVVTVRIAGQEFGPLQTGNQSSLRVEVLVPPGVSAAEVLARDSAGNTELSHLPLTPSPMSRVLMICPDEADDRVWLFATEPDGTAAVKAQPSLHTDVGTLSAPKRQAPGVYMSRMRAGADVDQERVRVRAELDREQAACEAVIPGELPASAAIALGESVFVAGVSAAIPVALTLEYSGNRRIQEVKPKLEVDRGRLTALRTQDKIHYAAEWQLPPKLDGATQARLHGSVQDLPELSVQAQLALQPGPAQHIELTSERSELPADGRARQAVRVRVYDAYRNAISRAAVLVSSLGAQGTLGAFASQPDGTLHATYSAPLSYDAGVDEFEIKVADTGASARLHVPLRALRRRFALGVRAGMVNNLVKTAAPMALADLQMRLPWLEQKLFAGVDFGVWSLSKHEARDDGMEQVALSVLALPLLGRLGYAFPIGDFDLRASGVIGVVIAKLGVSSPRGGTREAREFAPAFGGLLGASYALAHGRVLVEVGYLHASVSGVVSGNPAGLQLLAGYDHEL
jgi:hypothetical protein